VMLWRALAYECGPRRVVGVARAGARAAPAGSSAARGAREAPAMSWARARAGNGPAPASSADGQLQDEARAATRAVLDPQRSLVELDQAAGDRKAEAAPRVCP